MRRARKGAELEEIEAVYCARLPQLRRVAAAIVGDREAALDVVQEAFANAVRQRAAFRREGPLEAWLWKTVVNAALSRRREPAVATLVEEPDAARNGHEEGVERVRAALALLPERQRLVLFLRYYADLDYRTIGEVAGIAPGTVGAALNAGHARVSLLLEEVRR
jgi:RNA polymerase sigma factor (sigma-70 family)